MLTDRLEGGVVVRPEPAVPADHTQLFDLASDPHELFNLALRPEHGQRVEALRKQLERWQLKLGDDIAWTADAIQTLAVDLSDHGRTPDRWQPPWIVQKYFFGG